jgi:hypothetical protein
MQRRIAGAVLAILLAAAVPASAEPSDNQAGTLGEFAAAREVVTTLPPARPVFAAINDRQFEHWTQGQQHPRRTAAARNLWLNYGTGF